MMEEIQRSLGRVEGTISSLDKKFDAFVVHQNTLNERVSAVEKKVYWFSGITAAVLFFVNHFNPFSK
jgi:hypothetical protein